MDTNKLLSHKNWTEGGTQVTNFYSIELLTYAEAIEKSKGYYGERLVLSPFAYDRDGKILVNTNSLHDIDIVRKTNLNEFWRVFDEIKTNKKKIETTTKIELPIKVITPTVMNTNRTPKQEALSIGESFEMELKKPSDQIVLQCSLIVVNKVMETCPQKENEIFGISKGIEYWESVKTELYNLYSEK